jgi:LysR family transcriptional regulator for bpeEF and oprC
MEIFTRVADWQSFTKAAGALNMSPTKTSNYMAALEEHLGAKLFDRSTRHVRLTEEGRAYLEHCLHILAMVGVANAEVTAASRSFAGTVRFDLPATLASHLIIPALPGFIARYPDIDLELFHTLHLFDMSGEEHDVTLRVGDLPDSRLIGRILGKFRNLTVAAPAYLEKFGEPSTPEELVSHRCLHFIDPHTLRRIPWTFQKKGGAPYQLAQQSGMAFNEGESRLTAGKLGLGIFQALEFYVEQPIKNGELIPLLAAWEPPPISVWLAYPKDRHLAMRTKAFIDYITEFFAARSPDPDMKNL